MFEVHNGTRPMRRKIQGETIFEVPALAIGASIMRSFRTAFPQLADPYRNELKVYNGSGSRVEIQLDNGEIFRCRPDNFIEINGRDIRWYMVTARTVAINDDEVEIFENDVDDEDLEEDAI